MKIINLPQRSLGWHKWRKSGCSASAAIVILERCPYKTLWRMWAEKTGKAVEEDLSKNPNVMRGFRLEGRARQCCERAIGEDFLLPVCAQSDENPRLLASFDGLTEDNIPAELKCPAENNYESVVKDGEASETYQLYYPQVQQQIYVAGAQYGWLLFYSPEDNGDHKLFKVARDDDLLSDLVSRVESFWDKVQKNQPPPLDPKRDLFIPSGAEADNWIYNATDYRLLDQQIKGLEEKIKELKGKRNISLEAMQNMMGNFYKADFAGVNITRFEKQGAVDYGRLLSEHLPSVTNEDLENYRKDGTTQCRVTVTNQAMPRNIVDLEVRKALSDVDDGVLKSMYF